MAKVYIVYVENYGCQNLVGFQAFLASYNKEAQTDAKISQNDENELLKEMSRMAQEDLDRTTGG